MNPETDTVYVANYGDPTVSVINGWTHTVTATITVGNDPVRVAVDPATGTVYVTNFTNNTVSVINGPTNKVVAHHPVGKQPGRGRGEPGHPHRLRHQLRQRHRVGDLLLAPPWTDAGKALTGRSATVTGHVGCVTPLFTPLTRLRPAPVK